MQYFRNGSLIATHTTITLTAANLCYPASFVRAADGNTTVARQLGITYISMKVFK